MIDWPDERVAEAARRGSREAFSVLVARYARRVHSLCLRMTGRSEDAEDAAQDVFLRAFAAIERYEPRRRFAPWLLAIAANACRNRVRDRFSVERVAGTARDGARSTAPSPPSDAPLVAAEDGAAIRAALAALPPLDRLSLLLRYEEGLSLEETAAALGMPRGRAAVRVFRAKARLRSELGAFRRASVVEIRQHEE